MPTVYLTEEVIFELTEKHIDIVKLYASGGSAITIGKELKLSNRTVEFHVGKLRAFFKAKSIPHLVAIFFRRGLIK